MYYPNPKKNHNTYREVGNELYGKIKRLEERVKNDDLRSQKIQQLQQSIPSINFPSIYQVNTKRHMLKFASKHKHLINKHNIRGEFPPEKHPINFSIDEKLKLLLINVDFYLLYSLSMDIFPINLIIII